MRLINPKWVSELKQYQEHTEALVHQYSVEITLNNSESRKSIFSFLDQLFNGVKAANKINKNNRKDFMEALEKIKKLQIVSNNFINGMMQFQRRFEELKIQ
jgi:hypothetical protein